MRIQHNILAMNSYRNYTNNANALGKNLEKLSSGYKINRAGDDAAGLAISEKMRAQIQGLNAAQKNVKDGISLVKTAEGAMQEIQDMLSRMKYLATQSANGTYADDVDRDNLQAEVNNLLDEIDRIAQSANFNGITLLDGSKDDGKVSIDTVNNKVTIKNSRAGSTDGAGGAGGSDGAGTASATGNTPALASVDRNGSSTKEGVKIEIDGDLEGVSTTTGAVGKTVKVTYLGKTYSVTVTTGTVDADDNTQVTITKDTTWASLQTAIEGALQAQLNAATAEKAKGDDAFTAWENFKLTVDDKGAVTGATVDTVQYGEVTKVPKETKVEVDFSEALKTAGTANFKAGDKITIGDVEIQFVAASNTAGASMAAVGPLTVAVGKDLNESLENLAKVITDANKNGDLGFDAEYKDGKLTLITTKEFDSVEDFKAATAIDFSAASGLPKTVQDALAKAWNDAVDEAVENLGGDDDGNDGGLSLQIGDSSAEYDQITVGIASMRTEAMGIDELNISTASDAHDALDKIKAAINYVSSVRGQLGATQNRLEHTLNNLSVMTENIQDAESTIRDTDVADEMMGYVKNNILLQSAQAMLAQANQVPQGVLQLLG